MWNQSHVNELVITLCICKMIGMKRANDVELLFWKCFWNYGPPKGSWGSPSPVGPGLHVRTTDGESTGTRTVSLLAAAPRRVVRWGWGGEDSRRNMDSKGTSWQSMARRDLESRVSVPALPLPDSGILDKVSTQSWPLVSELGSIYISELCVLGSFQCY